MRLCRFNSDRLGVVVGDEVVDVTATLDGEAPIRPWPIAPGDWLIANIDRLRPVLEAAANGGGERHKLTDVALLAPVANPTKIIGAPVNFYSHHAEASADKALNFGAEVKTIHDYGLFLKANTSLAGPSEGIELIMPERRHDHEGEMVVVIGRRCRSVSEAEALDYVAGYTMGIDMTARGTEDRSLRKSLDTYSMVGPYFVTADEIADPDKLDLKLWVNDELRQDSNTDKLIFSTRKLIAYASDFYTLYPGDIIMTGTPSGVGRVLAGDEVRLEIEGLGTLVTRGRVREGVGARDAA